MEKLSILQYFFIQAYELEEINKNKVNDITEKLYRLQKPVLVLDR